MKQYLQHIRTEYDASVVTIFVARCVTMDDGSMIKAQAEASLSTQDALNALALTNGAPSGRWGDQEVGQVLSAEVVIDKEGVDEVPAIPAVAAVMQGETVITPAVAEVPAVPAVPPVTHLRYGGLPVQF